MLFPPKKKWDKDLQGFNDILIKMFLRGFFQQVVLLYHCINVYHLHEIHSVMLFQWLCTVPQPPQLAPEKLGVTGSCSCSNGRCGNGIQMLRLRARWCPGFKTTNTSTTNDEETTGSKAQRKLQQSSFQAHFRDMRLHFKDHKPGAMTGTPQPDQPDVVSVLLERSPLDPL